KSEGYTTIIVDRETSYFTQLGYQVANEYDLYSKDEDVTQPLLVKFLWDNLTDQPSGQVKYPSIMR
ncbi:N-acetyltransferase, partial [Staphylococcus warneri]